MKIWIVIVNCDEMNPSYMIDGVYSSEQKAKEAKEHILYENSGMCLNIEILEQQLN